LKNRTFAALILNCNKMNNIRFLLVGVLLAITIHLSAQTRVVDEAVFEKISKTFILNEDGSQEYHYYKKVRYNTQHAFHNLYGETFIVYNPEYQILNINKSITTMADGKVVETPLNAFNEVLPSYAAKAPAYNHLKEMVVTHTALEIGAVVELDYTITTQAGFYPAFDKMILFKENDPVREYEVIIKVPEGTPLKSAITATTGSAKPVTDNGMDTYRWEIKNMTGAAKDAAMPPAETTSVVLLASNTASYQHLFTKIVGQSAFEQQTLPASAQAVIDNILQETRVELMQVLEIQKQVVNNINTINIPDEVLGYRYATPSEVWQRNYGTEGEKAILMALMLKKAGFNAHPAPVALEKMYMMNIPTLSLFNQWVVKIILADGKPLYLSPLFLTDVNMKYHYLEDKVACPLDVNIESLRPDLFTAVLPINQISGSMTLQEDNTLVGHLEVKVEGGMNPYLAIEKESKQLKKLLTTIPEKSISDPKKPKVSEQKTEVALEINMTDACKIAENYYFFTIPEITASNKATNIGALPTQRLSHLQLQTQRTTTNIELTIPEGFVMVSPTVEKESRKSFGYYVIEITTNGNKVTINRQIEISEALIIPVHYQQVRNFLLEWNDEAYKQIIFKRK